MAAQPWGSHLSQEIALLLWTFLSLWVESERPLQIEQGSSSQMREACSVQQELPDISIILAY